MNGLKRKNAVIPGGTQALGATIAEFYLKSDSRAQSGEIVSCGRFRAKKRKSAEVQKRRTGPTKVVVLRRNLGKVEDLPLR